MAIKESRAKVKHIKTSPQKARLVVDTIRGKHVEEAINILEFQPKAVSKDIQKLIKSAAANAENNFELDVDKLVVTEAFVDQGPVLKRMRPRAQGRGFPIKKRTSHITVVLKEK